MQLTKTHKIILSVVAVLILLGIYIVFDRRGKEDVIDKADTDISTASTTAVTSTSTGTIIKTEGSGGYTIEQVPTNNTKSVPKPIPDLNRPVVSSSSVSVSNEAVVVATGKILKLQATLKANPADLAAWVDLGIYQKMAGDYEGTLLSWTYATKLNPSHFVAFANLGNLYAYFLKDNAKAEMYYKLAISKGSTQAYLYTQLAEVYRDIFNDLGKARAIVDQGLSKIPNDANLLQLKASLSAQAN